MITWRDVTVIEERNKAWMLEAEKERLLRQIECRPARPSAWSRLRTLFARPNGRTQYGWQSQPCSETPAAR